MANIDKNNRVEVLDYIRGGMALSIMLYHFSYYSGVNKLDPNFFLNKLGIYGVSIFFILSGLSLVLAYDKLNSFSLDFFKGYIKKRVFRIVPLFWFALIFFLLYRKLAGQEDMAMYVFFANFSLLFGFFDPSASILTGGWSIGVEVVLYACFPLLLIWAQNKKLIFILMLLAGGLLLYSSFYFLSAEQSFDEQWSDYILSYNHLYYFAVGILIAKTGMKMSHRKLYMLLFLSVSLFIFYPVNGGRLGLVYGFGKLVFSLSITLFVYTLFHLNLKVDNYWGRGLKALGDSSYSLYLLHPIVAFYVFYFNSKYIMVFESKLIGYTISGILVLIVSQVTYKYIEKPAMRLASWKTNLKGLK